MTEPSPIGLGVIGTGRIGAVHVRNIARSVQGARLIAIADADPAVAKRLADEVSSACVADIDGILSDAAIQGVIIATPTETHADLVAKSARAGKHVLCEKPISLQLDATRAAIAAAQQAGIILQVGFQRRFDGRFASAKAMIDNGELGALRFVRLVGRDHRMPSVEYLRTSGGQFRDQMIHEFDTARWLMSPRTVVDVYATGSALIDPELDEFHDVDTSLACLRFDDGTLAVIDSSRETTYGYDARAEIHGSKAMALVGYERFAGVRLADAAVVSPDVDTFIERFAQAYRDEVADFAAAIRERRSPRVGGNDALEALRVALAADRSLRERRAVRITDVTDG